MIHLYPFLLLSIFLIVLPGPDTAVVTKNTISVGKIGGLKTALGVCCALFLHTAAASLGLSAVMMQSALLFSALKYIGAVYLTYLGVKALYSAIKQGEAAGMETDVNSKGLQPACFRQGFLTDFLNPKVAAFFLTFLPQFVAPGVHSFAPFLMMGAAYTAMTAIWFLFYISFIHYISDFMKRPKTKKWIEGITGAVMIGFGIKLALEKVER
ncbi:MULTISPECIES: LysE family translocator [Geobacillus]|uniref:Lysine transporter LysE n=1 Tax=Geobacillus thermocatenulatus TaxID=33938 RepID=A0A226Q9J6_9BACL|nr:MULTISPECIES: LysE family translocator [Geobacillus]KPD00538.1 Leucine efflux protein [Geobacillus sp. BCO2]RAN22338.1 amino acid transporter LysE [Geobacillus sp. A8]ASS98320.1 lysine transporter LysE [Geobacillus thermocatenulatus]KLR74292.1 amino acid transporter LysE [Geobacillus sp. T6]OXB89081.1 lysine transporter LysE [Geobacillus thermocatenulatus]